MQPTSRSPVAVGDVVAGKFQVERVIGQGGMGVVVAATHLQLDQRVALKFLLPEVLAHPDIVQRFLREARASVRIHSEHVARVLDVGTLESGVPFMVMEFLEGEDLEQVLTRGPLPVQDAVGFVLEACEAVAEAHSLGMVHRDLKPANLFLARRPSGKPGIKVLDFGISKVPVSDREHAITKTASIMGSPGYMSPEQMMSSDKVDVRSDIWSLGVVLYELLGRRLPFPGATMPELVAAILQKAPEPLGQVRPDAPMGLVAVVDRCLQKDPAVRFANVAELARALAPFGPRRAEQSVERIETVLGLGPTSVRAEPPAATPIIAPVAPRVGAPAESATFLPTTSQAARPSGRRFVPAVVAVLVVGAACAGALALRMREISAGGSQAAAPPSAATASVVASVTTATSAALTPATAAPAATAPDAGGALTRDMAAGAPSAAPAAPIAPGKSHAPVGPARSTAPASSATPASGPSCHVVSYFDDNGDKHFKEECH